MARVSFDIYKFLRRSPSPARSRSILFVFFFYSYGDHRDLHSFPTRRSSDLHRRPASAGGRAPAGRGRLGGHRGRSEEHTSELQSHSEMVCSLLLEKKKDEVYRGNDYAVLNVYYRSSSGYGQK